MEQREEGKLRTAAKGEVLLREGQVAAVAYLVKRGTVALYRVEENRRVVLDEVGPGQLFGELSLLTREPFHVTAEATDDCELLPIDRPTLQQLLSRCPQAMQRMFKHLLRRLRDLDLRVKMQPTGNVFHSFCQMLQLLSRAPDPRLGKPQDARKEQLAHPVSYRTLIQTARNLLAVSQLELDAFVDQLARLGVIGVEEVKESSFRQDAFGERVKSGERVTDKVLTLKDPAQFLEVTRHLADEIAQQKTPYTEGMEFLDIHETARLVESTPEIFYKKLANNEIPENLFFLPRGPFLLWAKQVGKDFFKRVKRKRLNLDELESADDVVHVDDETLQQAFSQLGYHKLTMLYAVAGDEARQKMEKNLSKKIAMVVREEAASKTVDDTVVADVEEELYNLIRSLKGVK